MFTPCSSSDKMIGSHRVCFDCFDCFVFLWYFMFIFQGLFHQKKHKNQPIMSGWSLQTGDYLLFQRPTTSTSSSPLTRPIGEVPRPEARGVYVWPTVYLGCFLEPTKPKNDFRCEFDGQQNKQSSPTYVCLIYIYIWYIHIYLWSIFDEMMWKSLDWWNFGCFWFLHVCVQCSD